MLKGERVTLHAATREDMQQQLQFENDPEMWFWDGGAPRPTKLEAVFTHRCFLPVVINMTDDDMRLHKPPRTTASPPAGQRFGLRPIPVMIKGAGDLATGVAVRLHRAGFPVVMTELAHPLTVRRTVAFAQAVFDGQTTVEDIQAVRSEPEYIDSCWRQDQIPIVVDASAQSLPVQPPFVIVDAIMAKRNTGTTMHDAAIVIALGPGFQAGIDCHAVVETNRGHNLGRVIWSGPAQSDTGYPGALPGIGYKTDRVLRAHCAGKLTPLAAIGAKLYAGAPIAHIRPPDKQPSTIIAPFTGLLRGLIHPSVYVHPGMKIGDLDPRAAPEYCYTVSDKSLAIGGGVLEAICLALRRAAGRLLNPST